MKYTNILLVVSFIFISVQSYSQKAERPDYSNYLQKGSRAVNLQVGIAGGFPFGSVTALDISTDDKYYGLLALPTYGSFVSKNFMIGASAILGFNNSEYTSMDFSSSSSASPVNRNYKTNYSDFGVAPFARYYVQLSRRNVVNIFLQGSLPVFYSTMNQSVTPEPPPGGWFSYGYSRDGLNVVGSIGGGVSFNGRFGSLELNANNTGLYIGIQKYLKKK